MARTMTPEEYQELGRRYYKLKQYEKAIETLSEGIENAPTLGLYDHRAATYDKLNAFNAAVKDGREMIKLNKKEVKGYLRTASVLEKMDKAETALGIYKYGMKNVPIDDPNLKLLQQLHDRLTRKLSPATAIDPFTVMPVELAEMVLEYLSFRHMVNCMRVSKGWKDYLSKLPKLWMHLDLSGARRPVPRSFVNMAVRRSETRLTRLTVHRFEHMDMLKNLAKACKALEEVEIISLPHTMSATLIDIVACATKLKKIVIHPEITVDTATQILHNRPGLEHVAFSRVKRSKYNADWKGPYPSLKTFTMLMTDTVSALLLKPAHLLDQAPAMHSLTLSNVSDLLPQLGTTSAPPLTSLILKRIKFTTFPLLPPTLERLVLDYDGSYPLNNPAELLQSRIPHLTHLSLSGFDTLSADRLQNLLDHSTADTDHPLQPHHPPATSLHSLSIRCTLHAHDRDAGLFKRPNALFARSPRILTPALHTLDIATMPCDDDEIEHLLTYETGLTAVDVSYTGITGASIKMLADGLPGLKSIRADGCQRVSGRDAIAYAERKGVVVSCRMGEGMGGRKIRYG